MESCGTCRYGHSFGSKSQRYCHRNAPIPVTRLVRKDYQPEPYDVEEAITHWPLVYAGSSCGEYKSFCVSELE